MATSYPASLDNFTNPTGSDTLASPDHAGQHTNINDAVEAIETELGTLPKGSSASVKARLDAVDTAVTARALIASPTFTGTPAAPTATAGTSTTQLATTAFVATGIAPVAPQFPYRSGVWYKPAVLNQATTQGATLNTTTYIPFYVSVATTFDRIAIITGSTFVGTGLARLGIYNNSSTYAPSTVLLDAGTVATTGTSTVTSITISQALSVGWYWLAMNSITNGTTNSFTTASGSVYNSYNLGASSAGSNYSSGYSETVNATSGFATAVSPAGIVITTLVFLRAA